MHKFKIYAVIGAQFRLSHDMRQYAAASNHDARLSVELDSKASMYVTHGQKQIKRCQQPHLSTHLNILAIGLSTSQMIDPLTRPHNEQQGR